MDGDQRSSSEGAIHDGEVVQVQKGSREALVGTGMDKGLRLRRQG